MIDVAVESLRKRYGPVEALRGVSLTFAAGRLTAILGPSGCGKTTLLRSIAGFVRVDAGAIRLAGEDVTARPPQERGTAMVFQNYALWPHMTVFDNVAYGLRLQRLEREAIAERVRRALALVEIGEAAAITRRKPGALSGGQQQRVAVARAVAGDPAILLADEPTGNLDSTNGEAVMELLRELHQGGATICMVTHDARYARHAERSVHLFDGKVVEERQLSAVS